MNDNYVNSSVILPRGNTYTRGKVIGRKIYSNGNYVGRINNNPILDMHKYCVDFDYGEVRKLMKNVMAYSIYDVCDDSDNKYLMMD